MSAQLPPPVGVPEEAQLPATAGTYALHICLPDMLKLTHTHFRNISLTRGWYVYFGSAFGPGGIRGRVNRHLRLNTKPHWHIDWLLPHAQIHGIWHNTSPIHYECAWCHIITRSSFASTPVARFGSTDCRNSCASHLVATGESPHTIAIMRALQSVTMTTVRYRSLTTSTTRGLATSVHLH